MLKSWRPATFEISPAQPAIFETSPARPGPEDLFVGPARPAYFERGPARPGQIPFNRLCFFQKIMKLPLKWHCFFLLGPHQIPKFYKLENKFFEIVSIKIKSGPSRPALLSNRPGPARRFSTWPSPARPASFQFGPARPDTGSPVG